MNTMHRLLKAGDNYLKKMDLEDMAALKFCLLSLGTLLGLGVSHRNKKPVGLLAGMLFLGTYVPLMSDFVMEYQNTREEEPEVVFIHEDPAEEEQD